MLTRRHEQLRLTGMWFVLQVTGYEPQNCRNTSGEMFHFKPKCRQLHGAEGNIWRVSGSQPAVEERVGADPDLLEEKTPGVSSGSVLIRSRY